MSELPLVSPLDRVLFLRTQPHFARLDPDVLVLIANHSDEQSFRKGDVILEESASRPFLYFLVEGTVRTTLHGKTLFDVSPPGGVGLGHELARTDLPTGAYALTDVVTLRIEVDDFLQIMEDRFSVTFELLQFFSRMTAAVEQELAIAPGSDACVECIEPASDATLDLVQRLSRARQVPLFQTANLTMLIELLREIRQSYVKPNQWLFRAGQEPDTLYVIFEGAVRIEDPTGTRVAFAGPREVVALSDFLRNEPHAFGAVTQTAVQLLRIDKAHYIDVVEDHFDHALDLLALLSGRYLDLSGQLHGRAGP